MTINIDILAETNPAFSSLVILSFIKGYCEEADESAPYPILLLPLPIILSGDLNHTFNNTSKRTGFYRWLSNNPTVKFNLTKRIEGSLEFITPAIEYGFFKGIFILSDTGNILPNLENIGNYSKENGIAIYFKNAERLGGWLGAIKSERTIYNH
ncbi:three component ABC system middle component [Desulfotalea psychrophila]|uniref:Uncharacterized protein n=1 Tax=Desulfotalea psychrophila (strain LSv54 / DSM 12343) TaxID=177439 RepID=Q6AQN2_DESPS|nr:three component ABC system middle component [Desulfotalea psychrophila]CAG35341.1 unknown protein [Desulfotalea psychrophila LSv54]